MEVVELVSRLPRYTVLAGHSGTSTTWLLAQLAAGLAARPAAERTVLLDPKGDAQQMVTCALKGAAGEVTVLSGADASLARALDLLADAPANSSLLIDNAWQPFGDEVSREAGAGYLRGLRSRGHRAVIQAHSPDDLRRAPRPELLCVFPLMWRASEWSTAYPALAHSGALGWEGFDRPGSRGRCFVVDHQAIAVGVLEVGPEPQPATGV
jgi:hypothetical protein